MAGKRLDDFDPPLRLPGIVDPKSDYDEPADLPAPPATNPGTPRALGRPIDATAPAIPLPPPMPAFREPPAARRLDSVGLFFLVLVASFLGSGLAYVLLR